MATLVLGTVGRALLGPVGGAIGALIGNRVDHAVLGAPRRQGPRLAELAVQTSTYGTQMPAIFGTMRVAGPVIWATDLIESRGVSGGGKGRPGIESYSYTANFAVALSGRAIRRVGRIWADGRLLRGEGGDFKVATGFRLYLGAEDQAVDPLIASIEGARASAFRGIAYAVFEGLALTEFGNRIPQLTFEVEADDAPVSCGAIARGLSRHVLAGDAGIAVTGFAASGGSVRAVLAMLADISGGQWVADGPGVRLAVPGTGAVHMIRDEGMGARGPGRRGARDVAAAAVVPASVTVAHYDPARDYQIGMQRVRRPGGVRDERLDLAAALDATTARTLAQDRLARRSTERVRRVVTLGPEALDIAPGTLVRLDGEPGRWRVVEAAWEAMAVRLTCVPLGRGGPVLPASPGRIARPADRVVGATRMIAFEAPPLTDDLLSAPRLSIVAAGGPGWRQASLAYSLDDGGSWTSLGPTALPGVIGTVTAVMPGGGGMLIDRRGMFEVKVAEDLADADMAALDAGANLAWIDGELIQFGRAQPLGDGHWRLRDLRRGLRGTEAMIGQAKPGASFALVDSASVRTLDVPISMLGGRVRFLAHGLGDAVQGVAASAMVTGLSVLPPAPMGWRCRRSADGRVTIGWTRRSRIGWRWLDRVDVPLGEEVERYRIAIGEQVEELAVPGWSGTVPDGTRVSIRQLGTWGASAPLVGIVGEGSQ
ncbi:GTA baseplate fiber-binding domain-containing protein [Sphingomonas fuzhouensis]|uniref:GTA baseplate fiber-binding domain-containing protein n=1 Tax=Sphingomonas fuzhouensis TaxID=3106033 RepID=UPI002AFE0978|nr:phage tail protein [Sphingomonas sp. SGZ-02]